MRILFLICISWICVYASGQKKFIPEQIAFEYFENTLMNEYYERKLNFIINEEILECTQRCIPSPGDDSLSKEYWDIASKQRYSAPVDSERSNVIQFRDSIDFDIATNDQFIKRSRLRNKKKIREIYIFKNISLIPNYYLVKVSVTSYYGSDNYYIEIDKTGNISRWCTERRV